MSRDHYKGIPKKRSALLDADGNLEALDKLGNDYAIYGTATLVAGTVTVSDTRFKSTGFALVSTKHPYPTESGINWNVGDGFLTISGSTDSNLTVAYQVIIP